MHDTYSRDYTHAEQRRRDSQLRYLRCDTCERKTRIPELIRIGGGPRRCPDCHQRMLARHAAELHSHCPDPANCGCQCEACYPEAFLDGAQGALWTYTFEARS